MRWLGVPTFRYCYTLIYTIRIMAFQSFAISVAEFPGRLRLWDVAHEGLWWAFVEAAEQVRTKRILKNTGSINIVTMARMSRNITTTLLCTCIIPFLKRLFSRHFIYASTQNQILTESLQRSFNMTTTEPLIPTLLLYGSLRQFKQKGPRASKRWTVNCF